MYLSQKDKSLFLFIGVVLVALWLVIALISKSYNAISFEISDVKKITQTDGKWLNLSEPLQVSDLKDRAILLYFWNRSCISCLEALPTIKKLDYQLGSKLTVIGVYSAQFETEKDFSLVKNAVLKHDINNPVITDPDLKLWNEFEVKAWPTFILIKPNGSEYGRYEGVKSLEKLQEDAGEMVAKYRYDINRKLLPILPEKYNIIGNVLSFPSKLEYTSDLLHNSKKISALIIANSGQNNIIISSLAGGILYKIGSNKEGLLDGNFDSAKFSRPQGILYDDDKLYIADTGNHALRVANFKTGEVTTLIGNGQKGGIITSETKAAKVSLASPTDLEFFPDKNHIAISNAGTDQIISYDIKKEVISPLAGNGVAESKDGKYPDNSLSQPYDMVSYKDKLYFVDSISSALRVLDKNGNVTTLASSGLQHPLALSYDGSGIYIADSFNNQIKRYSFSSKKLSNFIGGEVGDNVGATTRFNSPEGILILRDRIYISDSNNNRIIIVNKSKNTSEILDVIPPLKFPKEGFLEYLPNLQSSEPIQIKSEERTTLKINLNKGWKINVDGPSFINLLEMTGDDKANLLASFDWYFVKKKEINLPKLNEGKNYLLQGSIYYCEDKRNALCYVKSYEQKILVDDDYENSEIEIKLGY